MRFPWRARCKPAAERDNLLPSPTSARDVESWRTVRLSYVWMLRRNTKFIILLMAMMEALKHGPLELAYAGTNGYPAAGPHDYGFAYNAGYIVSYIYVCIFMIVFIPLFSWWIPKSNPDADTNPDGSRKHSMTECIAKWLKKINMALLPFSIGFCLASYIITLAQILIYVDARPVGSMRFPSNNRRNWVVRAILMLSIVFVFLSVTGVVLPVLEYVELARVKQIEYYIILCPIQINMGVLLGSKLQRRSERRRAVVLARRAAAEVTGEDVKATEPAVVADEKQGLLVEV